MTDSADTPAIHDPIEAYPSLPAHSRMSRELFQCLMRDCTLCPRNCHADRLISAAGYCGQTVTVMAARAALHKWEEPCISGTEGSGTVFFSGCGLGCIFCQNHNIALGKSGKTISIDRLSQIFLELQEKGAHNINLVTPSHFIPQIIMALEAAKTQGLTLPVVYNTGSYEKPESLKLLEGLVDIYLPDLKYYSPQLSQAYANAPDYFEKAAAAIAEMVRQTGPITSSLDRGLLKRGTIVRHLLLPGQGRDSKKILRYLHNTYGSRIAVSIMNQFTPLPHAAHIPECSRYVSQEEYDRIVSFALAIGIETGYIQEGQTASQSFIPQFDQEGL